MLYYVFSIAGVAAFDLESVLGIEASLVNLSCLNLDNTIVQYDL